jgi:hypothetical protein
MRRTSPPLEFPIQAIFREDEGLSKDGGFSLSLGDMRVLI